MKMVKIKRDCILGKKGATVHVADHIAKQRIEDGTCVEVVPKSGRKTVKNKALNAKG